MGRMGRNGTVVALGLLGVLGAVGVGFAAIPSADGVINGCYKAGATPSGQLRVIDAEAGAKCLSNERALNWNQKGPKGDPGPPGLQGPPGEKGEPGAGGSTAGFHARVSDVLMDDHRMVLSKDLPAGKYMLSATAEVEGWGKADGYQGGIAVVQCWLPGYRTSNYYLAREGTYGSERKSLSLTSAIEHPGGAVALTCENTWNHAMVREAAFNAVKVDSLD